MKYRFRLTFHHHKPGFFRINESSITYLLEDTVEIHIFPRDSEKLIDASKFHADCGGFKTKTIARQTGEKFRQSLRLINCMFGLGLTVPQVDGSSGFIHNSIKEKAKEAGGTILDTIVGLAVYPDDGTHLESVSSGSLNVYPSDPLYVLNAVKDIWPNNFEYDECAIEAIEILNIAVNEVSPKTKFLTTYLALERLIVRKQRSEGAQLLIDNFIQQTKDSALSKKEVASLVGSLGHLKEQSFSSALTEFARSIKNPKEINGKTIKKFISECISIRNKIAHNAKLNKMINLEETSKTLRELALSIIWTQNSFPQVSVYRPADKIDIGEMTFKLM